MITNIFRTIGLVGLLVITIILLVATVYISMWVVAATAVLLLATGIFQLLQTRDTL